MQQSIPIEWHHELQLPVGHLGHQHENKNKCRSYPDCRDRIATILPEWHGKYEKQTLSEKFTKNYEERFAT